MKPSRLYKIIMFGIAMMIFFTLAELVKTVKAILEILSNQT